MLVGERRLDDAPVPLRLGGDLVQGDVVAGQRRLQGGEQPIAELVGVKQAAHVPDQLQDAGVRVGHRYACQRAGRQWHMT